MRIQTVNTPAMGSFGAARRERIDTSWCGGGSDPNHMAKNRNGLRGPSLRLNIPRGFLLWGGANPLITVAVVLALVWYAGALPCAALAQETAPTAEAIKVLTLEQATMCESIESYKPKVPAIVFSVSIGRVSCFTAFDPVPKKMEIMHQWYFRDQLVTTKRLHLRPPKWATVSSIQPRQADIGPWRVDIIDAAGNVMQTLRFSIVQ